MAAAKPLVVIIAFLLAATAAIQLPDAAESAPVSSGGSLPPYMVLPADPIAAGCRGPVGSCPPCNDAPRPSLGAGTPASTMAADFEQLRRPVNHQQRDSVPCSRRGASYYNCRSDAQANPYRRACSRIKNCRG